MMLPVERIQYGEWPRSGQIIVVDSRGNDESTCTFGSEQIHGRIHWGIDGERYQQPRWTRSVNLKYLIINM